jgi:REP element-mobilizing transposase RayT
MPQHIYHVTSVTAGRGPIFTSQTAVVVARDFATQRLWGDAEPLAWVVMPDHAHWLIQLGQHDALSTVMNRIKSATARHVRMHSPSIHSVWACGYHEHHVHRDTDLAIVAQYIVMNPVRAGLANKVGDYPFWNSVFL